VTPYEQQIEEATEQIRREPDMQYFTDLQSKFKRSGCIEKQTGLSQDRLLHLAAFCLYKLSLHDENGVMRSNEILREAGIVRMREFASTIQMIWDA
jgi:hypothetical protein